MQPETIPSERRALYYLGMVLIGAGFLLFISNFFVVAGEMGRSDNSASLPKNDVPMSDPDWWEKSRAQSDKWWSDVQARHAEHGKKGRSMMFRALGGMGLMALGGFLMRVGAQGWAGSGVVLSPEQARKDMAPWSKMGGGMVQDALTEVDIVKRLEERREAPAPLVRIRCRKCQALCDETARYCGQCGGSL